MLNNNQVKRLKNLKRLMFLSAWKRVILFITEPAHDRLFERFKKVNKKNYLTDPEPWLTFSSIDFIITRLKKNMKILEWGSGSSSLWFDKHGCVVTSMEHNATWARIVQEMEATNVNVIIKENKNDYVNPPINYSEIDIFLIDGIYRNDCASHLEALIKSKSIVSGSMIIFDDTSRLEYQKSVQALTKCCEEVYHFTGISNIVIDKMTSVYIV
jgi:16S rRNA G966 N2-methylase RsmD